MKPEYNYTYSTTTRKSYYFTKIKVKSQYYAIFSISLIKYFPVWQSIQSLLSDVYRLMSFLYEVLYNPPRNTHISQKSHL